MEKCVEKGCKSKAVWFYMPGSSGNRYCDEHVPRGCSCNNYYVSSELNGDHYEFLPEGIENVDWKWIEQDKYWCRIDKKGREFPCCEYDREDEDYE